MAIKFPSNRTLFRYCIYGAVAGITAVMYARSVFEQRIKNAEYFKQALKELRSHKGAISFLGEPIKEIGLNLADTEKNFCDGKIAKFEVSVKGSKDRGKIFFNSERNEDGWILRRLELELKSQPNRRLVVKKEES